MTRPLRATRELSDAESLAFGGGVFVLLAMYWVCAFAFGKAPLLDGIRVVLGIPLLVVIPGALVTVLLRADVRTLGRFSILAVGSSVVVVTLLALVASAVLPAIGVPRPLSPRPFAMLLTGVIGVLTLAASRTDVRLPVVVHDGPFPLTVALLLLPSVAALAAALMNRFASTTGMWVLVLLLAAVVLLTSTRHVPRSMYPLTVFSVGLSTLLHRNLLTAYVVGADVQGLVAIAERIALVGAWTPGASDVSVPVVTAFPAVVSGLTGLGVHATFKLVLVFLFAFVPLGVYYLADDVFDPEVGLYGAFMLIFYHLTFSLTPGKQLVSQLFVVAMLLVLRTVPTGVTGAVAVGIPSVGLILAHYGTTYAVGTALLFASLVVTATRYADGSSVRPLPVVYPLSLLVGATFWYWATAPSTFSVLVSLPRIVAGQILILLGGQIPTGSGASYVSGQQSALEQFNVVLYLVVTVLLVVGVGERSLAALDRLRRRAPPDELGYTALAVPLLALLASSYVLSLNLWADRVYQLVLVVLAPFVPVGYRALADLVTTLADRVNVRRPRFTWNLVAVLLVTLLFVNSGAAFALAGTASTATFNPDANDRAFDSQERGGAVWLGQHANVTAVDPRKSVNVSRTSIDHPGEVQVFTDAVTAQLFRSTLPPTYTTADVVLLKSKWRPELDRDRIDDGYVYLRRSAIERAAPGQRLPASSISRRNATAIATYGNLVYSNGEVDVVETGNATG